jgi:uncharacterized protein YkwD
MVGGPTPTNGARFEPRFEAVVAALTLVCSALLTACLPQAPQPTANAASLQPTANPTAPLEQAIWQAINQDRATDGLPPLAYDTQLAGLAEDWANDLAATQTLVHRDLAAVIAEPAYARFWTLGENLTVGSSGTTSQQIEALWMADAEHRAKVLSSDFNVVGIGVAYSTDGRLWVVADFGGLRA